MRLTDEEASVIVSLRSGSLNVVKINDTLLRVEDDDTNSCGSVSLNEIQQVHNDLATNATTRAYDIGFATGYDCGKMRSEITEAEIQAATPYCGNRDSAYKALQAVRDAR